MIRSVVSCIVFAGVASFGLQVAAFFGANTGEILGDFMLQVLQVIGGLFTGQGIPSGYFADAISSNLMGIGIGFGIILSALAVGAFIFNELK